ncbi:universal stress protein [Tranquillimonas alkanivorans]|uniref:Nucleotide-binding universal stress protein, UspA family n=1 Tax=Tranquillimonas alkanivorans TaxID=441119 RepID=A0A1I5N323_9RHOB|nr:universal stress protein [Tranquillimonas alkanivorans]SFP16124.1 Nucleotide-binding universal stress protein, UspA family [Tranquillimonas alkanivorans]
MTTTLVVGLDGGPTGQKALDFAKDRARALGDCLILICYVIEWSPYTFQTPEENEQRHQRREEEIALAHERVVDPAAKAARDEGFTVEDHVAHGDAAEILDRLARTRGATQIIIGRVATKGMMERLFGGVSARLIATSSVPVTIVP